MRMRSPGLPFQRVHQFGRRVVPEVDWDSGNSEVHNPFNREILSFPNVISTEDTR
uniref:Uncharacterized protein n=1 Tax=Helianthus annuus TaxID=4232 RepID=A0A251RQV5_HELAN